MVSGDIRNGHLHVGPLGPEDAYPRPHYRRFVRTTAELVQQAAALLPGAEAVYREGEIPYRRLRLGFNSWIFGLRNHYVDHRLHWFVRSLEAVLRLPRRLITRTFIDRGQELVGFSPRNEKLLKQLYDLRSCIEHVKGFQRELRKPRGINREQAFAFWSLCAELLASEIYKRIFSSADLRECFRSEARASGFWRRTQRTGLIGEPIDVWSLANRTFRQSQPEPWL